MKPRKLLFDSLEARQLLASGADFYELKSEGPFYADDYFFQTADPVTPSVIADGQLLYDLSRNAPGDQTIELHYNQRNEQAVRIKIDPAESYQFSYLTLNGEGAIAVDALNESGHHLAGSEFRLLRRREWSELFLIMVSFMLSSGPVAGRCPRVLHSSRS